ncbi:glycoside hydrolase family 95 protein [Pedobacter psychrodurus]|uniref:Glycoside hydrolase family 95 protein n=1 Tax=Pedobacter psychrodurus TaxID=2530456 RepID=A0A4R0PUS5_9SPHI|nr:glycoside hydrolase family 95 protein [Pedobacter psychrodurus]TCD26270.1 glycoside hydrolase family 95 protein [Pedobacter psychrodurus]
MIKKIYPFLFFILITCSTSTVWSQSKQQDKIWYTSPANANTKDNPNGWKSDPEWLKALPVGNGFLGAMVFGDVNKERIQLNEKSLWSGSPDDNDNPDAAKYIPEIRKLLFAGKYKEAADLTNKTQICKGKGSGQGNGATVPFGCYQTLGDLRLDFGKKSNFKNYYRELDLITGITLTSYEQDGVKYKREVFSSFPDRALVIRLTADKPNSLSFSLSLSRPERFKTTAKNGRLVMNGILNNGKNGDGMRYKTYAIPQLTGGTLKANGNALQITKATSVTIILTAATNYRLHYPDYTNANFESELNMVTTNATAKNYELLRNRHVTDFSSFMKRSTLNLNNSDNTLPTNELMTKNVQSQNESALYGLYYQYGRYLLLSSSRKGSLPANLQGIWANQIQTPWNGDYHTNINVQMNYWPAEVTNLSECQEQLVDLVSSLLEPGKRTAKIQYQMKGWVLHTITNVWGYTAPGEHPSWGMHVGGGGWMCQHLWEHYAFTRDKNYLAKVFPILKEASQFYLDWLVKDPKTGKLVSGPSPSPENSFLAPDGAKVQISMGPTHDQELINELFSNTLAAASILNINETDFLKKVNEARQHLAAPKIGSDGRLMEWADEFKEPEIQHRHLAHLYALYPGNQITKDKTPELAEAAKKSLEMRGDGGVGWTYAWKIALWARLNDGDRAFKILNAQLRPTSDIDTRYDEGGGSYYNLFDACPPFQIDGNFGVIAGITEMLMQSHEDFIELLPALPSQWKDGKIKGLVARGGFVVDMQWQNNSLSTSTIVAKRGGECLIHYKNKTAKLQTKAGGVYKLVPSDFK